MLCNLIIDGNYVLSKLVFTLHKNNLLFGALEESLNNTISNYRKWYPFANIYLVSDSKEKSWRKQFLRGYKATRKKDSDIDWKFVYKTYSDFKDSLNNIKVLESPKVEGDDWISYICEKSNKEGISTLIVSNDYDIKQLVKYGLEPLYINIMSNEMYNGQKIFLPKNYQIFLNAINSLPDADIFNLNDNTEFVQLVNNFIKRYEVKEVDPVYSLVTKLISGDTSDNIKSVWVQKTKTGKTRGIGKKGAETLCEKYKEEFGELDLKDPDLHENIADIICEKKKISKTNIPKITKNIKANSKLISLETKNIPSHIMNNMNKVYNKY